LDPRGPAWTPGWGVGGRDASWRSLHQGFGRGRWKQEILVFEILEKGEAGLGRGGGGPRPPPPPPRPAPPVPPAPCPPYRPLFKCGYAFLTGGSLGGHDVVFKNRVFFRRSRSTNFSVLRGFLREDPIPAPGTISSNWPISWFSRSLLGPRFRVETATLKRFSENSLFYGREPGFPEPEFSPPAPRIEKIPGGPKNSPVSQNNGPRISFFGQKIGPCIPVPGAASRSQTVIPGRGFWRQSALPRPPPPALPGLGSAGVAGARFLLPALESGSVEVEIEGRQRPVSDAIFPLFRAF